MPPRRHNIIRYQNDGRHCLTVDLTRPEAENRARISAFFMRHLQITLAEPYPLRVTDNLGYSIEIGDDYSLSEAFEIGRGILDKQSVVILEIWPQPDMKIKTECV